MKFLNFIIICFLFISCSIIEKRPNRLPASGSGLNQKQCSFILNEFGKYFKKNNKIRKRKIGNKSFAAKIDNYHLLINSLESSISNNHADSIMIESLQRKNTTLQDMINLLIARSEKFNESLESFKLTDSTEINDYISSVQNHVTIKNFELKRKDSIASHLLNSNYDKSAMQEEILENYNRHYSGLVGEIDFFFRFNHVVKANVYIETKNAEDKIGLLFQDALNNLQEKLMRKKSGWEKFKNNYSKSFKRIKTHSKQSRLERVSSIIKWIKDKEFDLIIKKEEEHWKIVEVKNYRLKMTTERLKDDQRGKSIFDQLIELKEILKMLELEEYFSKAVVFRNGISSEAIELIEREGIEVIKGY